MRGLAAAVISASRRPGTPVSAMSHSFADGKPTMVDVAITAGAPIPSVLIGGNTLREGTLASGSGGYNSIAVMPTVMDVTTTISVTVTVGALDAAANNRAVGAGVFSADGSEGVYIRFASASGTATLNRWTGGTETQCTSAGSQLANTGDTLTLTGTLSAGEWTWTVKKNGGSDIAALTWADSGHAIDLPGPNPGIAFRTQRSGSNFYSRGVTAIAATAA